jgi:K+-transporting ATPase ATPase C chain
MSIFRETVKAIRITLVIWLLTAIVYPLFILLVGQSFFPISANGSVILNINDQPIGSTLIGQGFTSDRYFHGRPSAVRYSQGKKAQPTGISGGSNLAPTNPELKERILKQVEELQNQDKQPVADLIYTSGSVVPEKETQYAQILDSSTKDYQTFFDIDAPTKWAFDSDRKDAVSDKR